MPTMTRSFSARRTYGQFLKASTAAFGAGQFEVAYHALMAALHCAEGTGDTGRLTEVAQFARETQATIDTTAAAHRLSTQSANTRGHQSLFTVAAVMADAARLRLESESRLAERRHLREAPGAR
jgi:hypothetical protein